MMETLRDDPESLFNGRLTVLDIMTDRLYMASPDTPVRVIRQWMEELQIRHIPVRNADGELVGMISDRDISKRRGRTAEKIMTPRPLCVPPQTLISPAVTLMLKQRISCLAVVEERHYLHGLLTTTDLLLALQCILLVLQRPALGPQKIEDGLSAPPLDGPAPDGLLDSLVHGGSLNGL